VWEGQATSALTIAVKYGDNIDMFMQRGGSGGLPTILDCSPFAMLISGYTGYTNSGLVYGVQLSCAGPPVTKPPTRRPS
jgi:hypothetical protein